MFKTNVQKSRIGPGGPTGWTTNQCLDRPDPGIEAGTPVNPVEDRFGSLKPVLTR